MFRTLLAACLYLLASSASAVSNDQLCDAAAQTAAKQRNVPLPVMRAITRVETGRTRSGALQPWPWTVNMEGKGVWFGTRDEALNYVRTHFDRGARSFDVGCFQINYRWHGDAFRSIYDMFEPHINADYAARFLTELYAELGSWSAAAGAYHSRTPKYAQRYRARFDRQVAALAEAPTAVAASLPRAAPVPRINRFPLLQAGMQPGRLGSLVPLGNHTARPLLPQGG